MKITNIDLVGYVGFYNGMGLIQINIDLTKCKTNKIIIRGSNGSGKSTLMSAINILPDTNDKFIPTMEARKVIELFDSNSNTGYIIRYIHPITNNQRSTVKGFISRKQGNEDWVELNPSGMITTCKEIIYDEFMFDNTFISLSQLSSEDRGLVDKRPIERKHMINSIVNSLETFNEIYKNINKKYNVLKSLMGSITNKIDMIGSEAKLMASLDNITLQLSNLEHDKQMTIENIAAIKIKLTDINNTLDQANYKEIIKELNVNTQIINKSNNELNELLSILNLSNIDELNEKYIDLSKTIVLLETDIDRLSNDIPTMLANRESEVNKIQDKQQQYENIRSEFNHINIKQTLDQYKASIQEYENIFNTMGLKNINLITKDEFNMAMRSIDNLRNMASVLMHNFELSKIIRDINNRDIVTSMINSYKDNKNKLFRSNSELSNINTQITIFNTKREIASELKNRPSKCTIDNCIYISEALKADKEYPESVRMQLIDKQKQLEQSILEYNNIILDTEDAIEIRHQISNIEKELNNNISIIQKLPIRQDFKETFIERMINFDTFEDIAELYKYIDCGNMLQKYQMLLENIKTYEAEYKLYESKQSIIDSIMNDISTIENNINTIANQIDTINNEILDKKKQLINFNNLKTRIKDSIDLYNNTIKPLEQKCVELQRLKEQMSQSAQLMNEYNLNLQNLQKNLNSINNDIDIFAKQRESINHSLIMLKQYNTELEEYKKQSVLIERIRYHSSPGTGIQNIYVGMFMNKILSTANQLLALLFNGTFVLQNFIVNETEFRIPIIGEGLLHDDISSMSSAQKALISMIISFSILQQSSTKYNIITLDEIDGPLDNINRFAFINLLDNLMSILHCEQAFIVSHNNELDTSMCDIISLKNDSNESVNGNIIWSF